MNEHARTVAQGYQLHRSALRGYLLRLVVREAVADDLMQETALRALQQPAVPADPGELRAWLFRVATNLAIDHLRREKTWGERVLADTRGKAMASPEFLAQSRQLAGSPEMKHIAKEHLSVCFACTLRVMTPEQSAALLLKEVYGFTFEETAEVMGASFAQVKGWVQVARASLRAKYEASCALVAQRGVCFQCVELDQFFGAKQGDPLAGTDGSFDARLEVVRAGRDQGLGPWHHQMLRLVAEVLDDGDQTN